MKRIVVLNVAASAAFGFVLFMGVLQLPLNLWPVYALVALILISVLLMLLGREGDAKWVANHMTRFGMIGTLIGMIGGLGGLTFSGSDVAVMATELVHNTALAFYSTLIGVVGNIWLNLNLRIKGGSNET